MSYPPSNDTFLSAPAQPDGMNYWTPLQKLAMRMGWVGQGKVIGSTYTSWSQVIPPFEYVATYECKEQGQVFVFGVVRGTPMTFRDNIHMFPTDSLIGQLRTLQL